MTLYVEEIFPVSVKNIAIGFYYGFGLSGGILSPFLIHFSQSLNLKCSLFLALLTGISMFSVFQLEESFGKPI